MLTQHLDVRRSYELFTEMKLKLVLYCESTQQQQELIITHSLSLCFLSFLIFCAFSFLILSP